MRSVTLARCPSARRGRRRCGRGRSASRARRAPSDRRAARVASRSSSSRVAPRGRVPAIGRSVTRRAFLAHQDLGRGADDVEVAEVEIEHVRRRIERAQRAVQRQRRRRERPAASAARARPASRRRRRCTPSRAHGAPGSPRRRTRSRLRVTAVAVCSGSTPARAAAAQLLQAFARLLDRHPARADRRTRSARSCPRGCRRPPALRSAAAGCRAIGERIRRAGRGGELASRCSARCRSRT